MNVSKYFAILAVFCASSLAQASNLGYTMLGIDYSTTEFEDEIVLDADTSFERTRGFRIYGAYQFHEYFFVELNGNTEVAEENDFELTTNLSFFAAGAALPLGTQTDVVLRIASVTAIAELCYDPYDLCVDTDDNGFGTGVGVRHMVTDEVELNADYMRVDFDDLDDSETLQVGAAYWFSQNSSLRITTADTEGDHNLSFGYRYTF